MDCYLCSHCKTVTNFPITGLCEDSPSREHQWLTGDEIEDQLQMIWDRDPAELSNIAG